ncbi:uncharacterized protein LOC129243405 [Anastrepha obliqua]|uniref:uncharacterized protein LOC129243405 n=1 Tax=Anastrepha obliqua TaxID=95512 RepID=UPI0024098092|nr:uncharacterized protein LOC129243405 [Anastrepha obliqua]
MVSIAGKNVKSTELNALEAQPKEGKDFKTAAAVITQQNYENTLRCQGQDLKTDLIENNSYFQYDCAEENTKEEKNMFDSLQNKSIENNDLHEVEENVTILESEVCNRKDIEELAIIDQHELKPDQESDPNRDEKEVFTISDDDSIESSTAREKKEQLNSIQDLQKENYVKEESPKMIFNDKENEVIDIDDAESHNGYKIDKRLQTHNDNEDEKKYEANLQCEFGSKFEIGDSSKESNCESTDEKIKDDNVVGHLTKSNADSKEALNTISDEEMENIQADEGLNVLKKDIVIDSKTSSPNENLQAQLKINGDHQMLPSPNWDSNPDHLQHGTRNIKYVGLPSADGNEELEILDRPPISSDIPENQNIDGMETDNENKCDTTLSSQSNVENDLSRVTCDDDNSHCSSVASTESNSTDTSSSHQLVIDHPMEEIDVGLSAPCIETGPSQSFYQTHDKSDKINTMKLSLKRKYSSCSKTPLSPKHKQPHLDSESNENRRFGSPCDQDNIEALCESVEEEQQAKENLASNYSDTVVENTPLKSLLLQHLQKPYTPPPPQHHDKAIDVTEPISLLTQPLENTSLNNINPPTMPGTVSDVIGNIASPKYLCFKCKTGSFGSFAALNEHQRECLADTRLLPTRIDEIGSLLPLLVPPVLATPPPSASPDANIGMTTTQIVSQTLAPTPIPPPIPETAPQKRQYYKCSSCNTFHENWNLLLHIREKHQRHLCLYCIRLFPTAEKLSVHLEIKHDLEQNHFNSEEALRKSVSLVGGVASEVRFLMCCTCQHLFKESDPFSDHNCAEFMKPCNLCGQKGRHSNQCKAHPDAKRTSKTKKKSKKLLGDAPTSVPDRRLNSLSSVPFADDPLHPNSLHCDNNQKSMTTAVPPTSVGSAPVASLHSQDSNSSSNMVIDESCTTTHSSLINPFKELDERWRLEQQSQHQHEANSPLPASNTTSPTESKLIVPKFKLRVPKEFQKSVDMALSSTESEEEDDDEGNEEESGSQEASNYKNDMCSAGITTGLPNENTFNLYGDNNSTVMANEHTLPQKKTEGISPEGPSADKNEWVDETNSNLARILQEIERTKLDIKRTKKTFHHPLKAKQDPSDEVLTTSAQSARNWTPTPPTSPKQTRWLTTGDSQKQSSPSSELMKPEQQLSQALQRRDSAGSDAMDIDETIMRTVPEQPPRENADENSQHTKTIDTGPELNTSSERANILDSSADTTASPIVGEELMPTDNFQQKQENELPSGNNTTNIDFQETTQHMQRTEINQNLPDEPADGIEVANDDVLVVDLELDRPLEKIEIVEFVRTCLKAVYPLCLYCNHARRIAVNGQSLVLHMLAQHRFSATVDSITAEELKPETICAKLKSFLPVLENVFFNSTSYCTIGEGAFTHHFNERIFECFQCRFVTSTHKELYLHNRKMHLKTVILCFMCRANFFSFSEILCHICPGAANKTPVFDVKFRCCLCDVDNIPSPFRLMVHLRKRHFACDVCLEDCRDQGRLSSHVWKHKLHHLCYRCGIAYRNKMDITKHLFWKHGTESIICKRCLQKRWRHVYHFCVPPSTFNCELCNLCFSKAMYLKVHKRLHSGDLRYPCMEENCDEKFISRKLLLKHTATHLQQESLVADLEQLGDSNEKNKFVEENGEPEEEDSKKENDQDMELNKTGDSTKIKSEFSESANNTEVPVKCEESESGFKANAEYKTDAIPDVKNLDFPKGEITIPDEEKSAETPRKKKKKNKRSKESLEDLNLIAPNLSETDSSEESDVDSKSRGDENSLVPKVMLSPPSEAENDLEEVKKTEVSGLLESEDKDLGENVASSTGKVLEIWKNFLQAQQGSADSEVGTETALKSEADYDEDNYPKPSSLHVVYSDHDYCKMFRPPSPVQPVVKAVSPLASLSPTKRNKATKSPRRASARHSASSSSSDSSSGSDSSCSCGSNCSCSSSGSDSSSTSSSSDDSDSSVGSNASRKRHRKKSERERLRKKSESVSPFKKHTNSETVNVVDDDLANEIVANPGTERPPSPPKEPQIYESDLETAESETDEEFYDKHPQKLASELLAQKRAQLMAQTRLSPSHNFDIVENSRPSTPSLPEDVVCETTRVKLKKKKRDRKSTCKSNFPSNATSIVKAKSEKNKSLIDVVPSVPLSGMDRLPLYELAQSSPSVAEPPMAQQPNITTPYSSLTLPTVEQLTPRPIAPHMPGRMSEGSSCSDADGSLKRSKRARRPNKFYGYTSDDENTGINLGQPLMMGMRAIKPQPPPQLTWRKEDLPTPSKSIKNQKNRTVRTPKTPGTLVNALASGALSTSAPASSKKKRTTEGDGKSTTSKRSSKKATSSEKLPPIPTLKIRSSQLGINNDGSGSGTGTELFPTPQIYSSSKDTDDEDDDNNSSEASSDGETSARLVQTDVSQTTSTSNLWNNNLNPTTGSPAVHTQMQQPSALQPVLPTPQATVFNHKIPPALLPNPNFETLQYFKANNIRYPIRPPAGARQAREGESVYCYCRCPYDEVSEMIACDGENCLIEWFHFECVGIMVAPQGKWFCAECRPKYSEELYPTTGSV